MIEILIFSSVILMLIACAINRPTLAGVALGIGMTVFIL